LAGTRSYKIPIITQTATFSKFSFLKIPKT